MYTIYCIMYTDNKKGVIKMSTVRINDNIKLSFMINSNLLHFVSISIFLHSKKKLSQIIDEYPLNLSSP